MPKAMENKLRAEGRKKGLTGKKLDAYVYGTMNKLGLMKGNKEVKKPKRKSKTKKSK